MTFDGEQMNGFKVGDKVRVIDSYNLERGTILSFGRKKIKVRLHGGTFGGLDKSFLPEKVAREGEKIVVVCNYVGRGSKYRIERIMYPDYHLESELVPRQSRIYEYDGVLAVENPVDYLNLVYNENGTMSELLKIFRGME